MKFIGAKYEYKLVEYHKSLFPQNNMNICFNSVWVLLHSSCVLLLRKFSILQSNHSTNNNTLDFIKIIRVYYKW